MAGTSRDKPGHDGLDNTEPEKVVITGRGDDALLRADVPVIHVLCAARAKRTWMAGTCPAMTA
jgi:hypothetical protein